MQLRTSRGVFVSWALVYGWTPLIYLALAIKDPHVLRDSSALVIFAIVFGSMILMFLWLRAFTLTIDAGSITYSTLFGGRRSIALHDVARIEWKFWYGQGSEIMKPPIRLEVTPKSNRSASAITINAKVFDRKGLAQFVEFVEQHIERIGPGQ